ncbi:hypothetical protein BA011_28380 (plasmid) [Rhizobium leguminosarum]|uniref:Uncharacterized protein n=1 Tax=Rhizobium leguminosarum TaxID=384 RepID=A0A1B1CIR8_RHILE|nr:hypothetical protein BA011_28380 [Rhizobium leguminosarum]
MGTIDNAFNGLVFLTPATPEFGLHRLPKAAGVDADAARKSTGSAASRFTINYSHLIYRHTPLIQTVCWPW